MRLLFLPALMLNGAIFGFFYAWVCSTMWGLDALVPEVAIRAMQGMNGSVRNAVFAPAFFGTGPVLLASAAMAFGLAARRAAGLMSVAGVIYIGGAMVPTLLVNVPMNEALALVDPGRGDAAEVWQAYSGRWQDWNMARAVASGLALCLTGLGLMALDQR